MTYLGNIYPVSALTQPASMWIFDTNISNQAGTLAGVFYIINSKIYVSTTDGSY